MVEKYGNYNNLSLTLGVLTDNLPALHLYQKYGFKVYNDETPGVYWMKYERN
jgi:ribosomal protein S18 acetylase RimI-like enzyme